MSPTLRLPWTAALPLGFLAVTGMPAHGEPLPLPSIDYSAKATMMSGMSMLSRHSNGKMRVE